MSEDTFTFSVSMTSSFGAYGQKPSEHSDVSHTSTYSNPVVWPELLKQFLKLCEQHGFKIPDEFTVDYNTDTSSINVTYATAYFFPDKQTISA